MNMRKKLVIIFLAGLFLVGLGSGIAFGEFSSFRYGGEKKLGGEITVETLRKTVPEQAKTVYIEARGFRSWDIRIEEDGAVAPDEILVEISCNKAVIVPSIHSMEDLSNYEEGRRLELGETAYFLDFTYRNMEDEFSSFLKVKDELLGAFKNRMIYSYSTDYIEGVVIKASPELAERIIVY